MVKLLTDHSNEPLDAGSSQLMNVDENKNDTSHICALTKLKIIVADDNRDDQMTQL